MGRRASGAMLRRLDTGKPVICVERVRLPLHDPQGVNRALTQTGGETVTVSCRNKLRLAVHNLNRPFSTGFCALPATVAKLFVYLNDLSFDFHLFFPRSEWSSEIRGAPLCTPDFTGFSPESSRCPPPVSQWV
jgi:hypothetical protein